MDIRENGLLKTEGKRPQETPCRRVAKFLLLIGMDEAAKVISHLTPEQTEKIIPEIASIRRVDTDEAAVIFAEFEGLLQKSRETGGVETARTILEKAFGVDRAEAMLLKAVPYPEGKPFEYLEDMSTERTLILFAGESPAVRALALSHLKPAKAAAIISAMSSTDKNDTVRRLATTGKVSADVIRRLDEALHEKAQNLSSSAAESIDGRAALAEILRRMDAGVEKDILTYLNEADPDLGSDIRQRLFTIEDIIHIDDAYMQKTLRTMSDSDSAVLINGKPDAFRLKIFSNVSKQRGALILEEEELKKPISRREQDSVTQAFFSKMRRAYESGEAALIGHNNDIYV